MELVILEVADREISGVDDECYREHIDAWRSTLDGSVHVSLLKGTHDSWLIDHIDVFREFLRAKLNRHH